MNYKCPKCGSHHTISQKRGFSPTGAIIGAIFWGPMGTLAGNIGKNKTYVRCLDCGYTGEEHEFIELEMNASLGCLTVFIVIIAGLLLVALIGL